MARWTPALLVIALAACEGQRPASAPNVPSEAIAPRSELEVRWVGADDPELPLVVLLHGYGARGDDLVGLAGVLHRRLGGRVRFAMPAAPIALGGGGRAWWRLDLSERPADRGADRPPDLEAARRAVIAWLDALRRAGRLDPGVTVIAGFSQGAMLAADVGLEWRWRIGGIGMFSGGPVDEARWSERLSERAPPLFMSHGRHDPLLAFDAAVRVRERFEAAGADVRWVAFEGGHTIPSEAVEAFAAFLDELVPPQ